MARPRAPLWLALPLGVLVFCAAFAAWWVPAAEQPGNVQPQALAEALAADPALPISAATTDVVLAIVCTFRRDHLEPYGYDEPTTPFLDELARHAVTFETVFAQTPWTRPSTGAIVTGRWPRILKLDNPGGKDTVSMVLSKRHTLLAEALGAAGYRAVGAVSNPNAMGRFGFAQGFDAYLEPEHTYGKGFPDLRARDLVQNVLAEADATPPERRFYARLLLTDTHLPRRFSYRDAVLFHFGRNWRYDASLRQTDAWLATLFTELRQRRPNTLFIVAADHGEGLRQPAHHGPGHGNHMYRSTVQVPLIVFHPALPGPGRRVGGLAMNIDLHPTILDLLGIAVDHPVDGRSQAPAVLGRSAVASDGRVFAETFFRRSHKSAVYDGAWQLVRDHAPRRGQGVVERLFAAEDVDALHDLAHAYPAEAERLRAALDAWEAHMDRLAQEGGEAERIEVDPETLRMLNAMGYSD